MTLSNDTAQAIKLIVDTSYEAHPIRLDRYLSVRLPDISRSRIQKLIDSGMVMVDNLKARSSLKLKGNEAILVSVPVPQAISLKPENIPLKILFEDQYLAVINKPAGMIVHPGAGVTEGTLVNALLNHMQGSLSGISGKLRPGIVHRLDKDTSGLIVVAKEDRAHRNLQEQIKSKNAKRVYLAVVEGIVKDDSGTVDKPVGRHHTKRKEMTVTEKGRPAVSHYVVCQRSAKYTLLKLILGTGRTHQIRVHMASLGYPVVGDLVYNHKDTGTIAARQKIGLSGHALHAFQLTFSHPFTGRLLKFEAPLPQDLNQLIQTTFGVGQFSGD